MQSVPEILKKIRKLELRARRFVETAFAGQYHSVFKGRGMNFHEFRQYDFGDEVRSIDWNVTARMGEPLCPEVYRGTRTDSHALDRRECVGKLWQRERQQEGTGRRSSLSAGILRNPKQRQSRIDTFHRSCGTLHCAEKRADSYPPTDPRNSVL